MKRILPLLVMGCALLCPISVSASEIENTAETSISDESEFEERTDDEIEELKSIYQELFPEEYCYIEQYLETGVDDSIIEPELVFDDTREKNDIEYSLVVFSNNQVFTNIGEVISSPYAINAYDTKTDTKSLKIGDLKKYTTIDVTYEISRYQYDRILSYREHPTTDIKFNYQNLRVKKNEDSRGNAYVAFPNSSISGTSVLYDFGVTVGHDNVRAYTRVASGVDMFINYLLNALV